MMCVYCTVGVCVVQQLHEINEAMRGGGDRTPGSKVKRQLNMLEASPYASGPTKRVRVEVRIIKVLPLGSKGNWSSVLLGSKLY